METPHVVILGGGFAGLYAAKTLQSASVRVTVVDRRNYHLFQPLLYQVATAALNPSDIAQPIRHVLRRQRNADVVLGEAIEIDAAGSRVRLADGEIAFDTLIVATGATHSYFGHDEWAAAAPGLKTIEDAIEMRRRILLAFEAAERETDPERRREWMTFVVVGGGPTGVELAGALAEISRRVLTGDFRHIDPREARVLLLEAGPRILATYDPSLSGKAVAQLERFGARVRTGAMVTGIDAIGVSTGAERIPSRTVLWCAGVAASPLARSLGVPLDRAGRVLLEQDLSVPGFPKVFVAGDLAHIESDGRPVPGVAPAAIQEGRHAAENVIRDLRGEPRLPFRYADKGSMATIGRAAGIAEFGQHRLSGLPAWMAWVVVHIFYLIGFRNRVLVMLSWAWVYLRNKRGARLITGDVGPLVPGKRDAKRRLEAAPGHEDAPAAKPPGENDGSERVPGP